MSRTSRWIRSCRLPSRCITAKFARYSFNCLLLHSLVHSNQRYLIHISDTILRFSFLQNKGEVAGVFTAVGLIVLALLIAIGTNLIRRHRAKKFDEEVTRAAAAAASSAAQMNVPFDDDDYVIGGGRRPLSGPGGPGDGWGYEDDPWKGAMGRQPTGSSTRTGHTAVQYGGTGVGPPLSYANANPTYDHGAPVEEYGMDEFPPRPGMGYPPRVDEDVGLAYGGDDSPYAAAAAIGAAGAGGTRQRGGGVEYQPYADLPRGASPPNPNPPMPNPINTHTRHKSASPPPPHAAMMHPSQSRSLTLAPAAEDPFAVPGVAYDEGYPSAASFPQVPTHVDSYSQPLPASRSTSGGTTSTSPRRSPSSTRPPMGAYPLSGMGEGRVASTPSIGIPRSKSKPSDRALAGNYASPTTTATTATSTPPLRTPSTRHLSPSAMDHNTSHSLINSNSLLNTPPNNANTYPNTYGTYSSGHGREWKASDDGHGQLGLGFKHAFGGEGYEEGIQESEDYHEGDQSAYHAYGGDDDVGSLDEGWEKRVRPVLRVTNE
ncbi:hypothetical protein SISSUDRAFT_318855 [Sistotremastrum suecicum HHB10207 ss-3]|uniref:Uncharacterized protein n=1 Tax=Sistotremastrum suecicum HHB10207 ss-3 TaxID=1314776 RepID=A0A165Z904_9AGAM|nr:hypothetical protein SISSUDRAFT_318855 [Sistotremastrum suecicum HHB10207 ss-3]